MKNGKTNNNKDGTVIVFTLLLSCVIFLVGSTILNVLLYHKKARINHEYLEKSVALADFGIIHLKQLMIRSGMTFPPIDDNEPFTMTVEVEEGRCELIITPISHGYYSVESRGILLDPADRTKLIGRWTAFAVIDRNTADIVGLKEGE